MGSRPFFDGEKVSQPDVTIGIGVTFIEHIFPGELSRQELPGLFDLAERLEAMPEFIAAAID